MMNYSQAFLRAVNWVMGQRVEGGFSDDPDDKGNWTGGEKGKGELRGTKFGISAAAYPDVDIAALKRDEAVFLYWRDYWEKIKGDQMPPLVAFVVFDAAVNQGVGVAVKLLQQDLGISIDGVVGPVTIAAARATEPTETLYDFLSRRAMRYSKTKEWDKYGRGWMKRLMRAAREA